MEKQTAVNWLEQEFIKLESTIGVYGVMYELLEQAKEMEKKQLIDAHGEKYDYSYSQIDPTKITGEQYYNETYGGK
jgi:hypothetical protein